MSKLHTVKFRVTSGQWSKLKRDAQIRGYVYLAAYLRDVVLKRNDFIESKILESNDNLKKILELLK